MALSAPSTIVPTGSDSYGELVVTSGSTLYKGALVGLVVGTGTIQPYNDAAGMLLIGYMMGPGNSVAGDGSLKAIVMLRGDILPSVTVTGASAATDNGRAVYATDDATITLTRPSADAEAIGGVLFWRTGTTCDVLLLGAKAQLALDLAGGNRERLYLGSLGVENILSVAIGHDVITGYELHGHGTIERFIAKPTGFSASYITGVSTLTLEINSTAVTGASLALTCLMIDTITDAQAFQTATPSAANEFHDGDTVSVLLSTDAIAYTRPTGGGGVAFDIFMDVEYRAGA